MSQSLDSSDDHGVAFEPGYPSDAESGIYCDEEFSEQQRMTNSNDSEEFEQQRTTNSNDSEEFEQQSKANSNDLEEVEQQSKANSNDSEEVEQQSKANSYDSEEVEQQSKANPHDDSGLDLPKLPGVTAAESLKETILEPQTIVTEFGPADSHSGADVADCFQQGDVAGVRVFTPRNFSFQELLDSNAAGCLNPDRRELGAPSDAAPSDALANEVEKKIPDHNDNEWEEWLIKSEGDV